MGSEAQNMSKDERETPERDDAKSGKRFGQHERRWKEEADQAGDKTADDGVVRFQSKDHYNSLRSSKSERILQIKQRLENINFAVEQKRLYKTPEIEWEIESLQRELEILENTPDEDHGFGIQFA